MLVNTNPKCRFDKIYIIGCGKIAFTVLKYVISLGSFWGFETIYVQHEEEKFSMAARLCEDNGVKMFFLPRREEVTLCFEKIAQKALIISAGNYYLFPQQIVEKRNLTIINFHYALLPQYRGRNAPSWAIYNDEKESGATWHYVTPDIDAGNIIWQGKCCITEDTKAYQLTKTIMELAQIGIEQFLPPLLATEIVGSPQEAIGQKVFNSKDIPGNGKFELTASGKSIYRLLRSLDFGVVKPLGTVETTLLNGAVVEIARYKRVSFEKAAMEMDNPNTLVMDYDNESKLVLKYMRKENSKS